MYYNFEDDNKKLLRKKMAIEIATWVVEIAVVIIIAYFIIYFAVEKADMIGVSMEKTINNGDSIIINKFSYRFSEPKRFDVIVFKQTGKELNYYNVKRIIGLPGETIQIKNGSIYINGVIQEDIVNVAPIVNYGLAQERITLEENEYFVLGDNRNDSEDSRFVSIGNVSRNEIIGKAFIRLTPFDFINDINLIKKETK
jgi:signal peptidase I